MYQQIYDPVAQSISATAAFAAIPLAVLFVMLGGVQGASSLGVLQCARIMMVVAIGVYGMPVIQTGSVALEGASVGFFPIIWIGINAIWVFKLTQGSGHDAVLRGCLSTVSADLRVHR